MIIQCVTCGVDVEARSLRKQYCKKCYHTRQIAQQKEHYIPRPSKRCVDCGKDIPAKRRKWCLDCATKHRKEYEHDKLRRYSHAHLEYFREYHRKRYQSKKSNNNAASE